MFLLRRDRWCMMVPMTDLAARAADPNTSHQELYQLAGDHPDLRPLIAENPNTYPDLLDWLGSLGDPQIDAALRRRGQATQAMPTLPQERVRGADRDQPAHDQPTEAFSAVGGLSYGHDEDHGAEQDGDGRHGHQERPEEHEEETAYYPAAPAYPAPAAAGHPASPAYQQPWSASTEEPARRRRGGVGCLLFGLLGFLLLAALGAAFFLLPLSLFGDDDEPQQEDGAVEEEIPQDQPEEQPVEKPAPEEDEATTEEDEEPEEEVEDLERPAPDDAVELGSFSAPSDNIHCQMTEDEVTCTINEYFFDAPSGCSGDVTLTVSREGQAQTDCGSSVGSQPASLNYGQTASNGDFACTSGEDGFECWSTRTGNGFFMAREDFSFTG